MDLPIDYNVSASSLSNDKAAIQIKASAIRFGITSEAAEQLPNPAELFLGAFSACILKNVERFSVLMNFEYTTAEVEVDAIRLEKPPRMDHITYKLNIYTKDKTLNSHLLQKNIEKFGTIFNTVAASCTINGQLNLIIETPKSL